MQRLDSADKLRLAACAVLAAAAVLGVAASLERANALAAAACLLALGMVAADAVITCVVDPHRDNDGQEF